MTITGDYLLSDQGSGGTWFVEIGGTTAGVDHDKLEVGQMAALDGTLSLELINDFIPTVGDRFDILDFTAASGTVTLDPSLAPLPEGLVWNLDDLLTTGELFVSSSLLTLPGDYSDNGIVDGADLLVWQKNLGSSVVLPNDDTPGAVTQADFDVWSTNFGDLATAQSSAAAIPEPSSATNSLILILLLILMGGRGNILPATKDPRRSPSGVLRLVP
ncbi:hypothetical protein OAS39_04315 [Pirellulales bacterium]|nr:hypothetical protein [Pirellulales bacterium]